MDMIKLLRSKNFAIIDCEGIQCSKEHICIRNMYILAKDGFSDKEGEFIPCKRYEDLEERYRRAYHYCKKNIHKLSYTPKDSLRRCTEAAILLREYIFRNNIDIILYKGGVIEKKLCDSINVTSYNIEALGVPKAPSHQPKDEVNFYYNCLLHIGCLFESSN